MLFALKTHVVRRLPVPFIGLALALALATAACGGKLDASFTPSVISGPVPLTVNFTPLQPSSGVAYRWDFGDANTSTEQAPAHTYEDAGDFTVTLTVAKGSGQGVSTRLQVRVEPGPAGWMAVTPVVVEVQTGDTVQFEVQAFDGLGNVVPDAEVVWSADPDAGEITPDGLFTAARGSGTYAGGVTATFERLGQKGTGAAALTFKAGAPAGMKVEPANPEITAGSRITFTATAVDQNGAPLDGGTVTFEALRSSDRIDNTGLFRVSTEATESETALVKVTVKAGGKTFEEVVRAIVQPGVLDSIIVDPPEATLPVMGTVTFAATGADRFGNKVKLDGVKWTLLTPEPGVVDGKGVFQAGTKAGDYSDNFLVVQGTRSKVAASASVPIVVLPGVPVSLEITPRSDSVPAGAGAPFFALLKDEYGNSVNEAPVLWESAGDGRVTADGLYVAPLQPGNFPDSIRATLAARALGNRTALTATASVTVRARSADFLAVEALDEDGGGIVVIDLATADLKPAAASLVGNGVREYAPEWSSDGSRIVFGSEVDGKFQVFDADFMAGTVRRLTDDPDGAVMPSLSPDGTKLAFATVAQEAWQIYVADLSGFSGGAAGTPASSTTARRLSKDDTSRHLLPHWAPDGKRLAYTRDNGLGVLKVIVAAADGSEERVVTPADSTEVFFGWSRDGARLLAGQDRGDGGIELITIRLESGAREKLAQLPFAVLLAVWSPDDSEIAIVDAEIGAMWLMDSDGTGLRQALSGDVEPRRMSWRPVPLGARPAG